MKRVKIGLITYVVITILVNISGTNLFGLFNYNNTLYYVSSQSSKSYSLKDHKIDLLTFAEPEKRQFTLPLLFSYESTLKDKGVIGFLVQSESRLENVYGELIFESDDKIVFKQGFLFADIKNKVSKNNYFYEHQIDVDFEALKSLSVKLNITIEIDKTSQTFEYENVLKQDNHSEFYWFYDAMAGGT